MPPGSSRGVERGPPPGRARYVRFVYYRDAVLEPRSNRNVVYVCRYHVVWCPKYRRPVLTGDVERRLNQLVPAVVAERGAELEAFEVVPDHVQLLVGVDPQFGIHRLIKHVKGCTSRVLREEFPSLRSRLPCLWTNSYFVATAGGAPLEVLERYVEQQKGR
jgi:putative transposase